MSEQPHLAECFFLDVGQGSSNVILLGRRRAIVIDCPRYSHATLKVIERFVDSIEALVVTHNDADHVGGVARLIQAKSGSIERLYILQDRNIKKMRIWDVVERAIVNGSIRRDDVRRLDCDDQPKRIFGDDTLSLDLLYPTLSDNLEAQDQSTPNATSAVVLLRCGSRRIVFSGDATVPAWKRIRQRLGEPILCDVLAVPHHGGPIWNLRRSKKTESGFDAGVMRDLAWVYSEAVRPRNAIVSVGTSNQHSHPDATHISALRARGTVVLCTQITRRCSDNLEGLRPGVINPSISGQSKPVQDLTDSGYSRKVACAGTVVVKVSCDEIVIDRLDEHQRAVGRLAESPGGHPLCRPASNPL